MEEKKIKWIIVEFVIGILLIGVTFYYVNLHTPEKKFLLSSVQIIVNGFESIISRFGGTLSDEMNKVYIKKRTDLVEQLINDEEKLSSCLQTINNEEQEKILKKIYSKVKNFENLLRNYSVLPLDSFIKMYNQYSLQVYALNQATDNATKNCK